MKLWVLKFKKKKEECKNSDKKGERCEEKKNECYEENEAEDVDKDEMVEIEFV